VVFIKDALKNKKIFSLRLFMPPEKSFNTHLFRIPIKVSQMTLSKAQKALILEAYFEKSISKNEMKIC